MSVFAFGGAQNTFGGVSYFGDFHAIILSGYFNNPSYTPLNPTLSQDPNNYLNIVLNWSAPINPTTPVWGYRIYRANQYTDPLLPIGSTFQTTYIDSGLDNTKAYYYAIKSIF